MEQPDPKEEGMRASLDCHACHVLRGRYAPRNDDVELMPNFKDYTPELQKAARKTGHGKMANEWYDKICRSLTKCPFCDLKEKYIIAERDGVVLSANLFPYIDYMLAIIPRKHFDKVSELTSEDWVVVGKLYGLAVDLLKEHCGIENTNLLLREGPRSGKSVGHLHFHVYPYEDGLIDWNYKEISVAPLEAARKLRKALGKLKGK